MLFKLRTFQIREYANKIRNFIRNLLLAFLLKIHMGHILKQKPTWRVLLSVGLLCATRTASLCIGLNSPSLWTSTWRMEHNFSKRYPHFVFCWWFLRVLSNMSVQYPPQVLSQVEMWWHEILKRVILILIKPFNDLSCHLRGNYSLQDRNVSL